MELGDHVSYSKCSICQGMGKMYKPDPASQTLIEIVCPQCKGEKYLLSGWSDLSNLVSRLDTIIGGLEKCPTSLILENTNSNEYEALDSNKKHWYDLFISAGRLDMSVGSKARDLFLAWIFPPGTASYTTILAALGS